MRQLARVLFVLSATPAGALLLSSCTANTGHSDSQPLRAAITSCSAETPWQTWKAYAVGDVVSYEGKDYACLQAHTSEPGWTPDAVPALWVPATCAGGGSGGSSSSGSGGSSSTGGSSNTGGGSGGTTSGGSSCDPSAWVYMGNDARACEGHLGESCGWTSSNLGQGYHCQTLSWGAGCEPGGTTCPGGSTSTGGSGGTGSGGSSNSGSGGSTSSGGSTGSGGSTSTGSSGGLVFSPYKDTSINMNWNTDLITTKLSGSRAPLATDLAGAGGHAVTLAFATGECGSENWGGVPGAEMASANVSELDQAGLDYIISTGGAAGSFSCSSDSGFDTFVNRWASPHLIGVDFDIEAGQSQSVITALVQRIKAGHARYPKLRFSLTLATLANNNGGSSAQSLGSNAQDGLNAYGDNALDAVKSVLGFNGSASSWPSYVTVNLMTMDYGSATPGVCVVSGGSCDMGQSAIQAAYNLHDVWGVPYSAIGLTPMIGGNDVSSEKFTLSDVDTMTGFAISRGLAGVHYWSYDRDTDCSPGYASPTCNSLGNAGTRGFLRRFLNDGLH